MKNKILIFTVIFILVLPTSALANDGGPRLDDRNLMTIEYKLSSYEIQIGGTFGFTLSLTNNTSYPINWIIIRQVIENDGYYESDSAISPEYTDDPIMPGEKVTYSVTANVPNSIMWYEKDGEYYGNFDLTILYDANYYSKELIGDTDDPSIYTWEHINPDMEPIPLKITNMLDGSNLAELTLVENETVFYFPNYQHYEMNIYNGELSGEIYNNLTLTNKSESVFEDVHMYNLLSGSDSSDISEYLQPGDSVTANIISSKFLTPDNIPGNHLADYKAIFKSDDNYYALDTSREFPGEMINCPVLSYESVSGDPSSVLITNISGINYENLYIDFSWPEYIDPDNDTLFEESQFVDVLKSGQSVQVSCNSNEKYESMYMVGLIRQGKLFNWDVNIATGEILRRDYYMPFYFYLSDVAPDNYALLQTSSPLPTESASAVSPSKEENTYSIENIQITELKHESSIPFGVWIILPAAIVCAGLIVFLIRKKSKSKDE